MCSRILTFVSRAACGNTESLFLIETSGVWELTEWSLSHRCLSPAHYREALWPLFSPIIRAGAPSRRSSITPNSLPSDGTSKPPAFYFLPDFISDLWGIDTHTHTREMYFSAIPVCEVHMPPKAGGKKKTEEETQLGCIVWRQAASTMPAGRQRSERPDIMLMEAFGWFLHDFTPHCSSQLSDTVTGGEWEACNSNKAWKILSRSC